jgi:hypothetical protein
MHHSGTSACYSALDAVDKKAGGNKTIIEIVLIYLKSLTQNA